MKTKVIYKNFELIFVLILVILHIFYRSYQISFGLPYFWNPDEISFQGSVLSSISFLTNYFELHYNPFFGAFINSIIILKSIFINEFLLNSLNLDQIKNKIYFNPELFLFYGRLSSLFISSISIFFLYLIFKKFKINFIIYGPLLITFATSIVLLNLSTTMGKNSSNLLIYLIQLYFLVKYLIKIDKFNLKAYLIFGILASIAWGINYWPAFVSIYAIFIFHLKKFQFSKLNYLLIFLFIFLIFGPILNLFFVDMSPLDHIKFTKSNPDLNIKIILHSILDRIISSLKIIYFTDKNIILLILLTPFFLINKNTKFKNEYCVILVLLIEPLIIFGFSGNIVPQLRYFGGIICIILILTAIIFNEFRKLKLWYLIITLIIFNFFLISNNLTKNIKINKIIFKNHSFFEFNNRINLDKKKIFYMVDLNFQESLDQNLYYLKLYDNNLIEKSDRSKKFLKNIKKKIQIIKNNNEPIPIVQKNLKDNIIYFNYTFFPIINFDNFFNYIKKDFDYVVIEENTPSYLSDKNIQKKIKYFVENNFKLKFRQFTEKKIFFRNQQSVLHYYSNTISPYDEVENIGNNNLEIIYGNNYAIYELN